MFVTGFLMGVGMILLGLYFIFLPERGIQLHYRFLIFDYDKRMLREGVREHPRVANCTARFVGFVFLLIGTLMVYASVQ